MTRHNPALATTLQSKAASNEVNRPCSETLEVERSLITISERISRLEELSSDLITRIQPVVAASPEKVREGEDRFRGSCEIAEKAFSLAEDIERINNLLEDTLEHLQL